MADFSQSKRAHREFTGNFPSMTLVHLPVLEPICRNAAPGSENAPESSFLVCHKVQPWAVPLYDVSSSGSKRIREIAVDDSVHSMVGAPGLRLSSVSHPGKRKLQQGEGGLQQTLILNHIPTSTFLAFHQAVGCVPDLSELLSHRSPIRL